MATAKKYALAPAWDQVVFVFSDFVSRVLDNTPAQDQEKYSNNSRREQEQVESKYQELFNKHALSSLIMDVNPVKGARKLREYFEANVQAVMREHNVNEIQGLDMILDGTVALRHNLKNSPKEEKATPLYNEWDDLQMAAA